MIANEMMGGIYDGRWSMVDIVVDARARGRCTEMHRQDAKVEKI